MHVPVLLNEVLSALDPQSGDLVADGTTNGGGHLEAIIEKMMYSGTYVAVDLDKEILAETRGRVTSKLEALGLGTNGLRLIFENTNYRDLPQVLREHGVGKVTKVLLDLGFSSKQLEAGRGFSYRPEMAEDPLDMRYSTSGGHTAAEVVNGLREEELADIFWKFGEERFSRRIAKQIVEARRSRRILKVGELVECVTKAVPGYFRKGVKDVVARSFQSLRIYVNGELENLEEILKALPQVVSSGGRVAIISFHSLEDRIVKNAFKEMEKEGKGRVLTKKPIAPTEEEVAANPRARSSKLRVIEIS